MQQKTREKIIKEMVQFAERTLPLDIDIERLKRAFPFHAPFFTDEGLRAFKNQRNIVTRLGQNLIPRIAQMIALDRYKDVHRNYEITGEADEGMVEKIRQIVHDLRRGQRQPDSRKEWEEILESVSGNKVQQQVIADLYIGDFTDSGPLFVEIKSPRPNLDICAETKLKMLIFRAIMHIQAKIGQAYIGLWYNPDIDRDRYSHSFTRRVMDMDREVLLGEELWNKIGGPGTYEELLDILQEVGRRIRLR